MLLFWVCFLYMVIVLLYLISSAGFRKRDILSSEPVASEQQKFMLHLTKRLRICERIRFDNISPTSSCPKGKASLIFLLWSSYHTLSCYMLPFSLFLLNLYKICPGTVESNWIQEPSDQSQDNGLLRFFFFLLLKDTKGLIFVWTGVLFLQSISGWFLFFNFSNVLGLLNCLPLKYKNFKAK